jgi:hypothetical protein
VNGCVIRMQWEDLSSGVVCALHEHARGPGAPLVALGKSPQSVLRKSRTRRESCTTGRAIGRLSYSTVASRKLSIIGGGPISRELQ